MKSPKEEKAIILVGTYRAAQMKNWILPKGYYNYPVGAEDDCFPDHCRRIKELWLYKGKTGRKVFAAEFLGVKARAELPDYPATKEKPHAEKYLLFKVTELYEPQLEDAIVHVRVSDFAKRTPKIAKAVKAFQEEQKLEPLLTILPNDVSSFPRERLCVREQSLGFDLFGDPIVLAEKNYLKWC